MRFERVGEIDLPRGAVDVRLMRIEGRPVLDVLALSTRADLREEELVPLQLHPDVKLLREYPIPRSTMVKFGDVDGDGRTDFVVFGAGYSAHAFTFDGTKRWSWEAPAEGERLRAEFEAPGAVWDLDGDGKAEVIHWREVDGREWLVAADGMTGAIKYRTPWPTRAKPHVYNNFRIAIGRLSPGAPSDMVLLSDSGDSIVVAAYDARLKPKWSHTELKRKDHLGHYVYPVDLDGDRVDEVVVGSLGARTYGNAQAGEPGLSAQVWWFDPTLRLISKWPALPLNGNPVFVQGDWRGDGREELFWYKFHLRGDGTGELYFPNDVFHMFDYMGDRAEEVITLAPGFMRVYGHRGARADGARVRRSADYLRDRVVNHTHY